MVFKDLSAAILVVAASALLCSCSLLPVESKVVTYDGKSPIYPAALTLLAKKKATIERIDVYGDEVSSGYVTRGMDRYKLKIKGASGTIRSTVTDWEFFNTATNKWEPRNVGLLFNPRLEEQTTSKDALKVVQSAGYDKLSQELLTGLSFNFLVLRDLTDLGREKWLNEQMKGRTYSLDLAVLEARKNTDSASRKKYVARFYYTAESVAVYGIDLSTSGFFIDFYTDDDRYVTMPKGTRVVARGALLDVSRQRFLLNGTNFFLSLEDA